MRRSFQSSPILVLPALHLLACSAVALLAGRDSWAWIWILIADIPVSYIVPLVNAIPSISLYSAHCGG